MTNYYDVPALSASGINAFYQNPLRYWRESPFNSDRVGYETTPAMLFGSLCHKLVLEPESMYDEYFILPSIDKRTTVGKQTYSTLLSQAADKVTITEEMYNAAKILADAIHKNKEVMRLLGNGAPEQPIYWADRVNCKAKMDYYQNGLIIDYKTTPSANYHEFKRSIRKWGYHRQAAWYMRGVEATYGEKPKGFVIIAQEKDLPEAIAMYLVEEEMDQANMDVQYALEEIDKRLQSGDWSAYPSKIQSI